MAVKKVLKSSVILAKKKQNAIKKAREQVKKEREGKQRLKELTNFEGERQKVREGIAEKESNILDMLKFYRDEYPELSLDRIKDMIYTETGMRIPKSLQESNKVFTEEDKSKREERQLLKKAEEEKRIKIQQLKAEDESKKTIERMKLLQEQAQKESEKKLTESRQKRLDAIKKQLDKENHKLQLQRQQVRDYEDKLAEIEAKKTELEGINQKLSAVHHNTVVEGDKLKSFYETRAKKIKALHENIRELTFLNEQKAKKEKELQDYEDLVTTAKSTKAKPEHIIKLEKELAKINNKLTKSNSISDKEQEIRDLQTEVDERASIIKNIQRQKQLGQETAILPLKPVVEDETDINQRLFDLQQEAEQIDREMNPMQMPSLAPQSPQLTFTPSPNLLAPSPQPNLFAPIASAPSTPVVLKQNPIPVQTASASGSTPPVTGSGIKFYQKYMIHPKDIKISKAGSLKFSKRGQKHANLLVRIHGAKRAGHIVGVSVANAVANDLYKKIYKK